MGFGRGVPLWALIFMICCIQQKVSGTESPQAVTIIPPLTTTPVVTSFNPAHNGRVCSTWGNFYYKTFDGDIYHFPGVCNYVFASHCNAPFEDFNIQIRHTSGENTIHEIKTVSIEVVGVNIEMEMDGVSVNNARVQLPYSESGVSIQRVENYVIVDVKQCLHFMWTKDSLMLELDEKYANQTCGLCGDFNGIRTYNEFHSNNAMITPLQFGNMQKLNGPTEDCDDPTSSPLINCANVSTICREILMGPALSDCNNVVEVNAYIESCEQDLCFCDQNTRFSCLCDTFAEYSRQCAHAGGHPQNWRTSDLCPKTCPFNMQYHECGSPCADTCTNSERSQLCEDHCLDGCFCPAGTVYDDINNSGCISIQECSCIYNGKAYAPGTSYSDHCRSCYCSGGQWSCTELPCPGICSVIGGSHISTYDEKRYDVHGDCTYVLSKVCDEETFTVLAELRKCGLTDTETCVKMVALSINGGLTTIVVKADGAVFVNWIYTQLPMSAANVTIFRPSSFFIIAQTNLGLQVEIQLVPLMQLFVHLDPAFKGKTCGLCGNFDSRQIDDFKAISGVVEGTAPAFANTWKTQAVCPNIKQNFEDPCSLSIENEKYAHHWCGLLTDPEGPFAKCHPSLNPAAYHKNCMFDTCNCEKSEDCMCAALSAYVRACAAKGVELPGWRTNVCSKYMTSCPKSLNYSYTISSCPPTCRSLNEPDITCNIKFVPVDGCTCINGTYMDDYGKCVPANSCPCYYRGTAVQPGEVLHDVGAVCTCTQGKLDCIGDNNLKTVCTAPMVYFDCKNATAGSTGAECQKSCQTLDMQCYSTQCMSGCMCPAGLVSDGKGNCIAVEGCPCIHNDATYNPGEKIKVDCNTCVCQNRMWKCTKNKCLGTCAVYGDGHFITFDDKRYNFNGKCEYTLVQDHCGQNSSAQGTFRIITENIPCGSTGTTCSKSIKVFLENYELILSEEQSKVVTRGVGGELPYRIRSMGIYLVIETINGVILLWDRKTSIFIKISPDFKGQVCGLCGNYDGNGINDFTTRSQSVIDDVLEFGNSWKVSPMCPDAKCIKDPCSLNPYRKSWSQKQCSIITSKVFAACHSQVEPTKYYEACVIDACACDSGGDCECFCTAVAAYAQACSEVGVCISWRTPSVCPMFCDYYNAERECDWHYKPCGAPCMKTCRNPSGRCLHRLPGLEGCYPYCPADKPYFNEEEMKCVDQCGCYDAEDNYYPLGTHFDLRDTCQSCMCTSEGIMCNYNDQACYCHYEGKEYIYKQVIYNTTDGLGWCMTATCDVNGTIHRDAYKCVGLTTTLPPFTFTTIPSTSGSEPTAPATTACVHKVCEWSQWYDVSYPTFGENNGDYETPDNIRAKGHNLCKFPDEVQCRAERFPNIKAEYLNQNIQCTKTNGLICNNKDQKPPLCYNYQIKFLCCMYIPCEMSSPTPIITSHGGTTPRVPLSTPSLVSEPTGCQPECAWTSWFDVSQPDSSNEGGDLETIEEIRKAGKQVCDHPQHIECRAEDYPDVDISLLGQTVQCDLKTGLNCSNAQQKGKMPMCYNYQVRFFCCDYAHCRPGTTPGATPIATLWPTTQGTTVVATSPGKEATTTLSTPFSTVQVTMPGSVSTPSVTSATLSTATATSLQSTPVSKPTASLPTEMTTPQVSTTPAVTATTLPPSGTTSPLVSGATSTICQPKCAWTSWFDVSQPDSSNEGGDLETIEEIRKAGKQVCDHPQHIECRAEDYPDVDISLLGQTVQCDLKTGLNCSNAQQKGKMPMCYNYQVRFYCCDYAHCRPGTTPGATPIATLWPTTQGTTVVATSPGKETTTTLSTPLSTVQVTMPGSVSTPSVTSATLSTATATSLQSTPVSKPTASLPTEMTTPQVSTTPAVTATTFPPSGTTSPLVSGATSTICQPKCAWTSWFDVSQPDSSKEGGDLETIEKIRKAGKQVCDHPQHIECRAEDYPDVDISLLGQTVQCDLKTGLNCSNAQQKGKMPMCYNYQVRFFCCDYTHCRPGTTPGATPIATLWPTTQGTTVVATSPGKEATTTISTPFSTVQVTMPGSVSTPSVTSATLSTATATSLQSTPVSKPTASLPTEMTTPQVSTTPAVTATTLPPSGTTSPLVSGATSTICQPKCAWTSWFDVSQPDSSNEGGDLETIEEIRKAGKQVCDHPQHIECRAEDYPDVDISLLGQTVQCDLKTGLNCSNAQQKGKMPMCYNYQVRFFCCDYAHCRPGTTPGATPIATLWPTTQGTTVVATSPGKETTTTLSTPLSTVQVTIPGSVSTPSVTSATLSTATATSLQSTPVSKPTASLPTEMTTPQVSTTPAVTATTLLPSGTTSPLVTGATSTICQPKCAWTSWFDVSQPDSSNEGGDLETIEEIRKAGKQVCDHPQHIECRAEDYPDVDISLLGQTVQCDLKTGLNCSNAQQKGKMPMCYNYQVRFYCCDYAHCRPGTTPGATPIATLWPTTQGTTVVATSPGKETTTTLSTPFSTVQVTMPGSVSTPSVTSATLSTATATSLQSTPVSKPTASLPTVMTTPQVSTTPAVTATTLPPSGTTSPLVSGATSTICQPKCAWTSWFDVSQPDSSNEGGDLETIEEIRKAGKQVCDHPQHIECRAEDYPDVDISLLGQTVQCDLKTGLNCSNAQQKGKMPMCYNYQVRFYCCDYAHCRPGTTPGATPIATLWPTTQGTTVVATSPGKEATTTLSTPLSTVQVTMPGSVSTPSVTSATISTATATSLQSTPVSKPTASLPTEMTTPQVSTTPAVTATTLPPSGTTSPLVSGATSTICQPKCAWTSWFDVSQPDSSNEGGDLETIEEIRKAGKQVCDHPQHIECRAEDYPDVDISLLGQTVQCDLKTGLNCSNAQQKGKMPMCYNYQVRFYCCDYAHCRPGTTPGATPIATLWPTTQGTTVVATSPGKEATTTLSTPLSTVQVTIPGSVSTPSVTSATLSTATATSLQSTPVSKPTASLPTEMTTPQVSTTPAVTATTLPPSGTTSPLVSGATSTICQPKCAWTSWFDVSQPDSSNEGGDLETIEEIRKAGKQVCDHPQHIECRAEDYPDVDISLLGQTVQCDLKTGLNCSNAQQKGKMPMCYNYQVRFYCCDYAHCRPGTTPGATPIATLWPTTQGTTVLATSPGKETTTTLSTPLSTVQVTIPGSVSTPSVTSATLSTATATSLQSTPVSKPTASLPTEMTTPQVSTTPAVTATTLLPSGTTSPLVSGATSTICQPKCAWTSWFDVSQPDSSNEGGDLETIEEIRKAGKQVCDHPQHIECRAEDYPDVDISLLGQTVQCDLKTGLNCSNAQQKGKMPMCYNYQVRFYCCDYAHCRPGTTPGATPIATLWPTTQGTTVVATSPGKETTTTLSTPLSTVQVTMPGSVSTPSVTSATLSTATATSLQSTPVSKPTASLPTEMTTPQVSTTPAVTATTLLPSGTTSPLVSGATSTICQPKCAWTSWFDVSQPDSSNEGGDLETIEEIRKAGKQVCDHPQHIECRAEDYPDVDISLLGQTVQCDLKTGLNCSNAQQKGKMPMCYNYQVRFYCCDYAHCRPGTTPGATPIATLWPTTQGTTVVATSPGKETTTTLSTPLSTVQVTMPGSVSTPSVTSATLSTATATSLQSTPVSKPTASLPTEMTTPQVSTTPAVTATTLLPSGTTSPLVSGATSTICQPKCAWTSWFDVSQPDSSNEGGDLETIEEIRKAGKQVCDHPQHIECRAEDYPDVDISLLGQTVQCDLKTGLNCSNAQQKGKMPMCYNYQVRFYCCDYAHCRPGTTPGATPIATLWPTTQGTTVVATSPGKETTTTLSTPLSTVQVTMPGSVSTPSVTSATLSTATATSLQSTPVFKPTASLPTEMTTPQVSTTPAVTATTLPPSGTTSPLVSGATSTICQPKCAWTSWFDVSQPDSSNEGGDLETIEEIRKAGKQVCDHPQHIECRAEDYPDVDISLLGQTVQCDLKTGLNCSNAQQKGKMPMCYNYQVRFYCCDYAHCRPGTTPGATPIATLWPTTQGTTVLATSPGKETTTTLSTPLSTVQVTMPGSVSTPSVTSATLSTATATSLQSTPVSKPTASLPTEMTTPQVSTTPALTATTFPPSGTTSPLVSGATSTICQPKCAWTSWFDVSQPDSSNEGGDLETIEEIRKAGKQVCDHPQHIECRAEDYPDVDISLLGQTVQCDLKTGLNCSNAQQKGKMPMCYNYQVRFYCCDYAHCRPGTTPGATPIATLWPTTQGTTVVATSPGKETTTTLSTPLSTVQVTMPGSVSTPSVTSATLSTATATSLQSTPVSKPTASLPTEMTTPQVSTTPAVTATTLLPSGTTSPLVSGATSTICQPKCAWTSWFDVSQPDSSNEGGDLETIEEIRKAGKQVCDHPQHIECRAEDYPDVDISLLGQTVQCDLKTGLNCSNAQQKGKMPMCYNYQVRFYCCDYAHCRPGTTPGATPIATLWPTTQGTTVVATSPGKETTTTLSTPLSTVQVTMPGSVSTPSVTSATLSTATATSLQSTPVSKPTASLPTEMTMPQVSTTPAVTATTLPPSGTTSPLVSGATSTICQPKCAWTSWFDVSQPDSSNEGGDLETIEEIRKAGKQVCDHPQHIECRAEDYPDVDISLLGQTVQCDLKTGLNCSNAQQKGKMPMCYNYQVRFYCCDYAHCRPGTTPGATPIATLWPTTQGTTVLATSPGKETTTTLSTPLSTVQVTMPGSVSTPSVTSATLSTATATSLQSTPVSKPTASLPTEMTTPQVSTTPAVTATTFPPSGTTSPLVSGATSTICQPKCAWTSWFDVSQPDSSNEGGDLETIEEIRKAGKQVCDHPQHIECRAEDYPDVDISLLGQTVQCDLKTGLNCSNAQQKGKMPMCYNYQVRFYCCDYAHCRPGTTPGATPIATLWPTTQGTTVVATSPGKETTTTLSTPLSTVQVTMPGSVSTPSVTSTTLSTATATSLQSTPVSKPTASLPTEMTMPQVSTTPAVTATTLLPSGTTSPLVSGATSTICQPKCAWTSWFDVSQPDSSNEGGDLETIEEIRKAGKQVCDHPQHIECRAEDYPDVDISLLGQTVQCDLKTGLNCSNAQQKGKMPMCYNYQVRFYCCDYAHCRPGTTPGATPIATLWPTTQGTTVLATSPGKETTTTLSTPFSTVQVTMPGSVSTPSVTSATLSTATATSLQSTPVSKPTASVPTEMTTPQVSTTPAVTSTSLPPSGTTSPLVSGATSTICQPKCAWTSWFDVSQPDSSNEGGDLETIEEIRKAGKQVCDHPQHIECRAEDYPDVDISLLGQTVQCDLKTGLNCSNAQQKGKMPMCYNYQVRFYCCDYAHCRPGTTPGATPIATLWPTTQGTTVVATSPGKETTTTLSTPLSTVQVTMPGSVSTPSVTSATLSTATATSLQSTPVSKPTASLPTEMTTPQVSTTPAVTATTLPPSGTTSPLVSGATSTICQPKCAWTSWFDVSQPDSSNEGGDLETIEEIRKAGKQVCDHPQHIECRAEDYPDVDISLLGQTVQCDLKTGLNCSNAQQKGKMPMCYNYQVRFFCCNYAHCRPGTTPGATPIATLWPTTQGTTVVATSPGKEATTTLSTPLSTVQVTIPGSVSTPSVTSATLSTATATSLQSTPVSKPTASLPTEMTTPQVSTTPAVTATTLLPSGTTSPLVSGATSTICQPKCAWTSWFDVSQPDSSNEGGDLETMEKIRKAGKQVCDHPQHIECRAEDYPDVDISLLGQTVQCDLKTGLNCSNAQQKGKMPMCYNYQVRFFCCDYTHCRPGTTPGATPIATLWPTTQGTTVVATSPGKEATTTLSTPLSTVQVTMPGSVSTPSVTSATLSTVTATSLQSTPVSMPTASVPTEWTIPEISSTPFASTTKIATTSSTGYISVTSSRVTPCFCHVSGVNGGLFSPGEVIYNKTDSSGCSFYAICEKNCEIKRSQGPCPSTSPSHPPTPSVTAPTPTILIPSTIERTSSAPSTAPMVIPTPVQDCPNANPPRKTNETWMYNNCSIATCEGNNRIVVVLPQPVEKITCENGLPPVKINHDDGCTYHYDCTCICSGWDNSHYETFDGTNYTFHDNCTYVLVQEIVKKHGNFSVLVDNYFCDPANNQSCSRSIIVNYNHIEVILSSQIHNGMRTNKVIFNKETIRTSFSKDGIIVADTGTSMSVEILDIHAFINFNGFTFSIQVPFDLFAFNTEGQCGTCSNDRSDDCRLPSGHKASSCSEMAPHWKVNDNCEEVTPTPEPTGSTTTPSIVPCTTPSPLCELIVSDIFSDCHKVLPPTVFYDRCLSEACQNASGALTCYSVEMYASLCIDKGFCSDWRSKTQGKCPYHCPEGKVYEACGPVYPATCDNGKANITEHVAEGCFCPADQILVNSYTDTCVPDCKFCIGPDGFPKMPGTTWRSNCQECTCDQLSVTVQCKAQPCSTPKTPACEKEGFMPVSVLTPEDPCCPEIQCICNTSVCSNHKKSCEPGYQLISILFEGDCCVSFLCEPIPDICVVNGTVYTPGAFIPSDSCETCVCGNETDPGSKKNLVECEPIQCDTACSVGYEYQVKAGECCGTCVQVTCTINVNGTTQVLKPGDIWQPEDNNCSHFECEKEDDKLILVNTRRTCPIFDANECDPNETELTPDGCCKICKPQTNCKVRTNQILVRQNDCVSSELVELTYCEGSCPSSSMYSTEARAMQHKCTCCQELKSHKKEVSLTCQDGRTINYDYIYVDECQCMTACIPEATAPH